MKYNYFSPGKAGKYLLRDMFLLNNKTTFNFSLCERKVLWSTSVKPNGQIYWYWEDLDGNLVTKSYKVNENFLLNYYYSEQFFYIPTDGKHNIMKYLKRPESNMSNTGRGDYHKVFPIAMECDYVVNPLVMLGYSGNGKQLAKSIVNREPNLINIPLEYVIDELNKRKNIVTHKEDLRHLAKNYFIGIGHLPYKNPDVYFTNTTEKYIKQVTKQINLYRQLEQDIANLLDYYNIKYEWFNLDKDSYEQYFNLDKVFDKEIDPHHKLHDYIEPDEVVEGWIDDYVRSNP